MVLTLWALVGDDVRPVGVPGSKCDRRCTRRRLETTPIGGDVAPIILEVSWHLEDSRKHTASDRMDLAFTPQDAGDDSAGGPCIQHHHHYLADDLHD